MMWQRMPFDGQGLAAPPDADLAALRRWAAADFWQRVPWWSRPLAVVAARLLWVVAASWLTIRFVHRQGLAATAFPRLWLDCLLGGAAPLDALIWRRFIAPSRHPLPSRAATLVLSRLGDAAAHRLLADKHATAALLSSASLPTPPLLELIAQHGSIALDGLAWSAPGQVFVKPRHGFAGRGAMAVEILADGRYRLGGGPPIGAEPLRARLRAEAARDDLLVQPCLNADPEMADLATAGAAPVLRLTTARHPGGAPLLHSALLCIAVPGRHHGNFLHGHLYVPVDHRDGRLGHGIGFAQPGQLFARTPWNDAPLAGRLLPAFAAARTTALRAMALMPNLPLINWDLIVTADGPVILEGNSGGNWILTNIAGTQFPENEIIEFLMRQWADMSA